MEFDSIWPRTGFDTFQAADTLRGAQIFGDGGDIHGTFSFAAPAVVAPPGIGFNVDG